MDLSDIDNDNEVRNFRLLKNADEDEDEQSSSSSESNQDHSNYEKRVELLQKTNKSKQDDFNDEISMDHPKDLNNLNEKLEKQRKSLEEKKKDNKPKKQKKSFVSPYYLKTLVMMSIARLYKQSVKLNTQEEQFMILSYFSEEQISRIQLKLEQNKSIQDKLLALLTTFQQVFMNKKSSFMQKRTKQISQEYIYLYPDEYISKFAMFAILFGIKVRLVMALDLNFVGLEKKFRVQSLAKENKKGTTLKGDIVKIPDEMIQPVIENKLLKQMFNKTNKMSDEEQAESLDQFLYTKDTSKSKSQSNISLQARIYQVEQQQSKNISKKKQSHLSEEFFELNNNLWLEAFYDNQWYTLDPINDKLCTCNIQLIKQKLHKSCSFYILTTNVINLKDDFFTNLVQKDRIFKNIYFVDLTYKYLITYKTYRIQLQLEKWFNRFAIKIQLFYNGLITLVDEQSIKPVQLDREEQLLYTKAQIPNNPKDFKYHQLYTLESQLNQYQMIKPGALPIDLKIKDEHVYYKTDITVLHSKDRWREQLLQVKDKEIPLKEVTSRFDKTKVTQLFAEWQCEPLKISLEETNNQLPFNQYGNFEMFIHPPPKGTVLFPKLGIKRLLLKQGIQFVEAVDGFDSKTGKLFAQKCGYLIFQKDLQLVKEIYETNLQEVKARNKKNKTKELLKLWSDLFKAILIKKQLQETYKQQQE